jgi:hypothetical protein
MRTFRGGAWSILLVACAWPAFATAQELCGIDDIFNNGFETPGFVPIAQVPGGVMSAGLAQDITGPLTAVAITSPTGTTSGSTVDVLGTFTGPVNTGITVNGVYGLTVNGSFLVPNVPLSTGANTLTAQALTLTGQTASGTGSVTQGGSPPPTAVNADHPTGIAPFVVNFTYVVGTLPSGKPVQSVTVNFRGTGPNDYSGTLAGAPTSFTYSTPGLYTAQFQVTDTSSNTYTATRAILIQDFAAQRSMVCDIYGYLKDRLNAQDATGASNAFQPADRSTYLTFFNALGANMPAASAQLGAILDGQFAIGYADLLLERDNSGAQTRSGFPLRMTQGTDGVWRISEM